MLIKQVLSLAGYLILISVFTLSFFLQLQSFNIIGLLEVLCFVAGMMVVGRYEQTFGISRKTPQSKKTEKFLRKGAR